MKKGFTLIELLIVVAIIGILAAIAVPNFMSARTRAKVARAEADMRSIATAMESFVLDNPAYPNPNIHARWSGFAGDQDDASNAQEYGWEYANTSGIPIQGDTINGLTHPQAYMSSVPFDPFDNNGKGADGLEENDEHPIWCVGRFDYNTDGSHWIIASVGPSKEPDFSGSTSDIAKRDIGTYTLPDSGGSPTVYVSELVETLYLADDGGNGSPSWFLMQGDNGGFSGFGGKDHIYDPRNGTDSQGMIIRTGP